MKQLNEWHTDEEVKHWLSRCQSTVEGTLTNGLFYDEELSGPDGAHFTLFVPEGTDRDIIDKAKSIIRNSRDATGFSVVKIKREWADALTHNETRPAGGWIESLRWIVEHKQCRKIDAEGGLLPENKAGGQLCDLFTASRMVQIYDALNATNREKFDTMSFAVAHHVAMQL